MRTISLALAAACLLQAGAARAHIELISPPDRFTNNSLSPGPCGSGMRSNKPPTKLVPGQTLTVSWKEVVGHAGHYRIALSARESDFTDPTSMTIPNPSPSWVLLDGIQDKTGTQTYSQAVQIPDKECPTCVLQVIQVASGGNDGTNTGSLFAIYHACADVSITGGAADGGLPQDALGIPDAARGDAHAAMGGATGGAAGQGGSGGASASNGGSTGGTGGAAGHEAGSSGSGGASRATGGQGEGGSVSSGSSSSGSTSASGSGGHTSSAAGQGGGGHASLADSSRSGGVSGTSGGAGAVASAGSSAGSSRDQSNKPAASGGCDMGYGSRSSPWFMLAFAFAVRALLRKKRR